MSAPSFSVSARSESATRVRVKAPQSRFEFVVDKPLAAGGTNEGPNPLEYLLGSLAGCVGISGQQAAAKIGMTLQNLAIHITAEASTDPAKVLNGIAIRVKPESDADDATLEQWLALTEKLCVIHHLLEKGTPITFSR